MKLKHDGFSHLLIFLLLLTIALVGFAGWRVYLNSKNNKQKPVASVSEREAEETLPEDLNGLLGIDKVVELALAEKPGSQVAVVELEQEGQSLVYKVVLSDGTVFKFNAASGHRLAAEFNKDEDSDEALPNDFTVNISLVEAVNKAKETLPGKKIRKVQLELEDGIIVYSVRFTDGSRVDVNAATGEVVRTKDKLHEEQDEESSADDTDDDHDSVSSDDHDNNNEEDDDGPQSEDDADHDEEDDADHSGSSGSSGSNSGSGGGN